MRAARSGAAERGSTRPRCSSPSTWNASDEEGELEVYVIDAELAAERLADTARYLVVTSGRPPDALRCPLLAALRALGAATATGTAPARVPALLEAAQRRVAPLVDQVEGLGDDGQRVAFAVARLADALAEGRKHHPTAPADDQLDATDDTAPAADRRHGRRRGRARHGRAANPPASEPGSRSRRARPSRSGWPRAWPSSAAS